MATIPLPYNDLGTSLNIGYLPGSLEEKLGYRLVREIDSTFGAGTSTVYWGLSPEETCAGYSRFVQQSHRMCSVKRKLHIDEETLGFQISRHREGLTQFSGPLPTKYGQMTRCAIAWWTDAAGKKAYRVRAERIHLTRRFIVAPSIFEMPINPFNVIFQNFLYHSDYCQYCREKMNNPGLWRDGKYVCLSCDYELDSGLRPGISRIRRK